MKLVQNCVLRVFTDFSLFSEDFSSTQRDFFLKLFSEFFQKWFTELLLMSEFSGNFGNFDNVHVHLIILIMYSNNCNSNFDNFSKFNNNLNNIDNFNYNFR